MSVEKIIGKKKIRADDYITFLTKGYLHMKITIEFSP